MGAAAGFVAGASARMKLVLDTKPDSGYRDELARRYHFPSQYKRIVDEAVGDWVVFRRPRAGGGHMGYIGVGQVESVEPDPETPGHHYAVITNFLAFDEVVPWNDGGRHFEAQLRDLEDKSFIGRSLRGRSARPLAEEDFAAIVGRGLSDTLARANARRFGLTPAETDEATRALLAAPPPEQERRIARSGQPENSRGELPAAGGRGLRLPMRGDAAPDHQRRRTRRGPGGACLGGAARRARHRAERDRPILNKHILWLTAVQPLRVANLYFNQGLLYWSKALESLAGEIPDDERSTLRFDTDSLSWLVIFFSNDIPNFQIAFGARRKSQFLEPVLTPWSAMAPRDMTGRLSRKIVFLRHRQLRHREGFNFRDLGARFSARSEEARANSAAT